MHMPVGQLDETLAKRKESAFTTKLGDLTVTDDATLLMYGDGTSKQQRVLDETAANALTKFLKVPPTYYQKLTPDFRAQVLRYEFDRHKDVDTVLEVLNDELVAVHDVHAVMLPLDRVVDTVHAVFNDEDTIRRMIVNDQRFHLDVTTDDHQLLLEGKDSAGNEVGDITEAGVRFLHYPFKAERPSVSAYAERLTCLNGQTTPETLGRIAIKGRTIDEIFIEMESAANLVLSQLDDQLALLGKTKELYPPGSIQAFVAQLCKEAKVKREVLDRVLEIINQLPEPVSIWDVNQAFTSVANEMETYALMTRLQNLGGALAFNAEKMIERCGTCERLL